MLELAKPSTRVRRAEQTAAQTCEGVHAASHIREQHDPHVILTRWAHHDLQVATIAGCLRDRIVDIELFVDALAGHRPQLAKCCRYLAGIEHQVLAIGREASRVRNGQGTTPAAFAPDPNPRWMVATLPKGRSPTRADPTVATLVAFFLLGEALLELLA